MMNIHANTWQKACKGTKYPYEHGRTEIHKCLVAISFQGDKPHELLPFHGQEKIFDSNIKYYSDQSEDELRNEIVRLKKSETHDLSASADFDFVRCANRRVKCVDGDIPFGIKQSYIGMLDQGGCCYISNMSVAKLKELQVENYIT